MKKFCVLIALSLLYTHGFTQGEANNWYFGSFAGMAFNGGTPTALTNGVLSTAEGCASISDKNGNLLFYTDGIKVWNRNHVQMTNGFGMNGDPSSAQSAIIVPKPGNANWYYIFTVAAAGGGAGFCYSELDMTANAGLGDVVAATKNTPLFTPSCEKCTAVKHANGLYVWVLAHSMYTNRYYAYLVDCSGVAAPVTTDVGSVEGWPGWGYLEASPDGHKIATAMRSVGFEVLDFDNSTGVVSNPLLLSSTTECYGISFSPNNNVLYACQLSGGLWQWNLQAGTPAAVIASQTSLGTAAGTGSPYRGGAMQLGPDGKLYVCQYNQPYLTCINNPDVVGAGCNLQVNAVDLLGRICILGLPPFIQSYFDTTAVISYTPACPAVPTTFSISSNTTYLDSVKWDFGDVGSGAQNFSTALSPSHTYATAGNYNVQLIRYILCVSDTTVQQITVNPQPAAPAINSNSPICPGSDIQLSTAVSAAAYSWTGPNGFSSSAQNPTITAATANNNGTYSLAVTQNGCISQPGTAQVTVAPCTGPQIAGVINDYTAVTAFNPCTNSVTVADASAFSVGDRVLLIEMKGATVDTTNTATFGDILTYGNAGNYEYGNVAAITANDVQFVNKIIGTYDVPGQVQLVRIPQYTDVVVTSPLTCLPWNGASGGILAFDVSGTLTLMSNLDVSGQGFRLGPASIGNGNCHVQDYVVPVASGNGAYKGEGIVVYSNNTNGGRGKLANGGGGGNMHNAGGGGGGNYGAGGNGGDGCAGCCGTSAGTGGIGGLNLNYNLGRLFMGGGGGGGHQNGGTLISGGTGGGMIMVNANTILAGNGMSIVSNGQASSDLTSGSSDGVGGGGAGGTVAITAQSITGGTIQLSIKGGKGGDNALGGDGAGGGGAGGSLLLNNAALQSQFAVNDSGGLAGYTFALSSYHGSQPGQFGGVMTNLVFVEGTTPWRALDTPQITSNTPLCAGQSLQFNVAGNYTNTATYAWVGPNGYTSTLRNPAIASVTTADSGTYTLVVSDSGCSTPPVSTDAAVHPVYASTVSPSICMGTSYNRPLGIVVNSTGTYIDTLASVYGCDSVITTNLTVLPPPVTAVNPSICLGGSYTRPSGIVVSAAGTYIDTLIANGGCDSVVTTNLTILPPPVSDSYDTICQGNNFTRPSGIVVTTAGNYVDTLIANGGCDSVVFTHLTVRQPSATAVNDTICNGGTFTLQDGNIVSTAGLYPVTLTNQYGCDSVVTTNLAVIDVGLSAQGIDVLCNGQSTGSINATASGGVNPYDYDLLQGGSVLANNTNGTFSSLAAGNYNVNTTDDFGCTATASVQVVEPAALVVTDSVINITCYDAADGQVIITANGGTPGYNFNLSGDINSSGYFTGLDSGNYPYAVTDAHGCIDTASVVVTQPLAVVLTINPDLVTIKLGESGNLNATTNYGPNTNYLWSPATGLSCSDCPNPVVTTNNTMNYHLVASVDINGNTCEATANAEVVVIPNYDVFIPNIFTPNGDGNNDVFKLFGNLPAMKFVEVGIFNRIGEKVFSSNDIYFEWDGLYKGRPADAGVYVYQVKAVFADNHTEKLFKGTVTLLR